MTASIASEPRVLRELRVLDRALIAKSWPALSTWWSSTFNAFVGSLCRQLVIRVGRRGGKSSSLSRFAVAFALAYDLRRIPPGDVGVVAFLSTSRDEANQRLRTIKAIFDALGVAWKPIDGGLELVGRPILFRVHVASIASVSGFTCILAICDEVAKWRDQETGANPATEVLAALRPTMATQPAALLVLSSSPLGSDDAHAKAYAAGDTAHQTTAYAPTWEANPTITEDQTRRDEPDVRIWSREYLAMPQAAKLAAFDEDRIARACVPMGDLGRSHGAFGVLDPSSGKADAWTWAVAEWRGHDRSTRKLVVSHVDGIEGDFWSHEAGERVVSRAVADLQSRGVRVVYSDQRESLMLAGAFARRGLRFVEIPWTAPRKERAVTQLRRWFADDRIALPNHAKLRAELLAFEEKISPSGALTFGGGRGTRGRDDYVALLVTTAMAETEPKGNGIPSLPGSPVGANAMVEALRARFGTRDQLGASLASPPTKTLVEAIALLRADIDTPR